MYECVRLSGLHTQARAAARLHVRFARARESKSRSVLSIEKSHSYAKGEEPSMGPLWFRTVSCWLYLITHFSMSSRVSEQASLQMSAVELASKASWAEQGNEEWCERTNGRASGPVLTSHFWLFWTNVERAFATLWKAIERPWVLKKRTCICLWQRATEIVRKLVRV